MVSGVAVRLRPAVAASHCPLRRSSAMNQPRGEFAQWMGWFVLLTALYVTEGHRLRGWSLTLLMRIYA